MKHSRCKHWGGFTVWELLVVVILLVLLVALLPPALRQAERKSSRIGCVNNLKQIGTAVRLWAGDNNDRPPDQVPVSEGGLANTNATKAPAWAAFQFFQVMSNELNTPKILCCPQDLKRPLAGPIGYGGFESDSPRGYFGNLVVSYFAGCNTAYDRPQMIVSGDRNIHGPTPTDSNDVYGFSPTNGSGARVVFGTNPAKVGWTSRIHRNLGNVAFADGSVQQLSSAGLLQAFANSGDTNTVPGANVIVFP